MENTFRGQVIWITGASGALGAAIGAHLHELGARVVLSARHAERLPQDGQRRQSLALDVTDRQAVEQAAAHIVERHGRIDALVASATIPVFGDFLDLDDDDWLRVLDTKLLGTIRPARAVLPGMMERGAGRMVFISGRGGTVPPPRHLPGACANAAINLLVQGLATAHGRHGIRVNAVAPGPVASPRLAAMQERSAGSINNALGRPAQPFDVAAAVAFLLSDAAGHITGTTLQLDGGRAP